MAPNDPNMVAALRRERAGYQARGLDDRVAQVDEQLEYYGAYDEPDTPQDRTGQDPDQQTTEGPALGEKKGRGRPRLPRDAAGNIVRE